MVQAVRLSSTGKHQFYFSQAFCCVSNNFASYNSIEELAKKHNASMAQVSLAWVMAKDGTSCLMLQTISLAHLFRDIQE